MEIYVLLLNARTENEGIHTIQMGNQERIVLMFESEDDATRYALLLEAQDFPGLTVEAMDAEEIEEFCQSAGYECQQIPADTLAIPPEANLDPLKSEADSEDSQRGSTTDLSAAELESLRRRLENLL